MAITKEKPAQKDKDLDKAVFLMQQYRELHLSQQSMQAQKKELEKQLHELAEKNLDQWFANSKTLHLDVYGKIAYTDNTVVKLDLELYDEMTFAKDNPDLVEIKPKASAIKGYCINAAIAKQIARYGVSLDKKESFVVTPNK